ncbi:MAG: metal-dependent hydrolase [Kiritimatiellae bacterium]|nr:metal-dependent hydrolase [Verrucomicrobiota bacterium]MBU4285857.1 metal-dependent hydrolase [Verrucomicrobiota bacterium]MBU4365567.1 metal-dependent hydrolase [Verrucomicrobiota bacterium]MCG2659736.1 metal-dependent hydrolase [Kiritimatiellia bacterium]
MPSPIAHSLIGLILGLIRFLPRYRRRDELASQFRALWRLLLFCVLLANVPDLDYFFGIFRDNLNYYHQTVTHTLVWVGVMALAIWAYGRLRKRRASWLSFGLLLALLGSHLLADWLTVDRSPPIGVMLAWPFSDRFYHAAFAFFPPPAKQTWADLWSLQNLRLVLVETAITLPAVIAVLWFKHDRAKH